MDALLLPDLEERFGHPLKSWSDHDFREMAIRVFRHQFQGNSVYRSYCEGRNRTPRTVEDWREIPPVPANAFKRMDLFSGDPGAPAGGTGEGERSGGAPEAVFLTSGTTRGEGGKGRHPVLSLDLYRAASVPWFGAHLVPEGGRLRILSLVPSPAEAPSSSLSRMMGFVARRFGTGESAFLADPVRGVRADALGTALAEAQEAGEPVLLMGTAFAFVHWLDEASRRGWRFRLPAGSRLMETGGFKGRSRRVPRVELYRSLEEGLGIPVGRMVNEYGMTELLSQLYEPVLREPVRGDGGDGLAARSHRAPPWMGIQVLDPATLVPRATGEEGLLAFFDMANVGSVSAILTEDMGWLDDEGGLHLLGRVPGAEPRGCSLAMEALLEGRE